MPAAAEMQDSGVVAMEHVADIRWDPGPGSQRAFFSLVALLFAASAAVTIAWCAAMADMGEISMPGGWMLSMTWMPMCEQTWFGAAASFIGMWIVMMVAMMLPSLAPVLWQYRQAAGVAGGARANRLTAVVGLGYFSIWALLGAAVFAAGAALAEAAQQLPALARVIPAASGAVVVLAGALQFSRWKARHLACCRPAPAGGLPGDAGLASVHSAWRHGLRLGRHCGYTCAGMTALLLVLGVMDLRAMAVVMAAITLERLAPTGDRVARVIGVGIIAAGLFLIARAAGLAWL